MEDCAQLMFSEWGKDHVRVVRHHAPREEAVSLGVEVTDGIGDDLGDLRVTHIASAYSAVEAPFGSLKDGAAHV